jgi:hypothetical protein
MNADELERFEVDLLETYASKMTDVTLVNMKAKGGCLTSCADLRSVPTKYSVV